MIYILRLLASTVLQSVLTVFHFLTINYFAELPPPPDLLSPPMKKILILGGSSAGISTAHRILKQSAKTGPVKITIVSPNTHFYWNVAAPRAILPGLISDEKMFLPIAAGFKQYKNSQYQIITGRAQSVDFKTKTVQILDESGERTLDYDYLILATGSRTASDIPFKTLDTTEQTRQALHDYQAQVKKAKTIVIGGAGPTGVETAGELAFEYGKSKRIILVPPPLPLLPPTQSHCHPDVPPTNPGKSSPRQPKSSTPPPPASRKPPPTSSTDSTWTYDSPRKSPPPLPLPPASSNSSSPQAKSSSRTCTSRRTAWCRTRRISRPYI